MNTEKLDKARKYEHEYGKSVLDSERPIYHVTGMTGWINDPNGFSEYKKEYHLFYQHYPYANEWGEMHWGHVKSKDFITWERLPVALAPDEIYDQDGCFSGSALELNNGEQLIIYTGVQENIDALGKKKRYQTQCIAIGDGRDYKKYRQNPVISQDDLPEGADPLEFRDPKIWFEEGFFYVVTANKMNSGSVFLHRSKNLLHWEFCSILDSSLGELGNMWECPDFFSLNGKQILLISPVGMKTNGEDFHPGHGTICCIGEYDKGNYSFKRENHHLIDYGIDFYAPQTMKTSDGRRIMIGWMQAWSTSTFVPEEAKYFGQMTVPRELTVVNGKLYQNPVRELKNYRQAKVDYFDVEISNEELTLDKIEGRVIDLTVELLDIKQFHQFVIQIACDEENRTLLRYDTDRNKLCVDRSGSGFSHDIVHMREITIKPVKDKLKLRILLDRYSMEIFLNDGEKAATFTIYTPQSESGIKFVSDGRAHINIEKYSLNKK